MKGPGGCHHALTGWDGPLTALRLLPALHSEQECFHFLEVYELIGFFCFQQSEGQNSSISASYMRLAASDACEAPFYLILHIA